MVNGLKRFRDHFKGFEDRYVLIGGTACDLAFTERGLPFRATKDLDIVLCLESLDADFAKAFWEFVRRGEYEQPQSPTGITWFYRFQKPTQPGFPAMLELFSRAPDALGTIPGHLTPIPIDHDVSSLSAILMDKDYYAWIHAGRVLIDDIPVVRPEHLIPLKARAWLDLTSRAATSRGDSADIKKHKNDVFRLAQIVDPEYRAGLSPTLRRDVLAFLERVSHEPPNLATLGIRSLTFPDAIDLLRSLYQLNSPIT